MDLTFGTKAKAGARWRRRGRLAILVGLAAASGCATRPAGPPTSTLAEAVPPNLLEVASIAPAIDADLTRKPHATPRPPAADRDPATQRTSASPTPPVPEPTPPQAPADEVAADASTAMAPAAQTPPSIPEATPPRSIDLSTALLLADNQNPIIGEARAHILEALALRTAARSLLLPSLNSGFNYHDHNGPLQRSSGEILPLTEQSLYYGGGARTLAAESLGVPMINIATPLTEALFEPLAAEQRVVGTRLNASATANTTLLEVAGLYIELVGNEAELAARRELAADADRIASEVAAYAVTGQGRKSDSNRAEADRRLFQAEIQRAEEEVAVTSARLSQRLSLDPSSRLQPLYGPLVPITLIDADVPVESLISSAMARRPDLAARDALAMEAKYQVQREKARPFLPTIWLGFSAGEFGGGSDIVPPALGRYQGRNDFDIRAYWTLLNFGVGNTAQIKRRKAIYNQAVAERMAVLNEIRAEVSTARAEVLALRSRVEIARRGVRTSEEGYRQDQVRLRETIGKPIEVLDSLRLLVQARVSLIRAITEANRAQFALFVSLGAPPPLENLAQAGLTPAPPASAMPR